MTNKQLGLIALAGSPAMLIGANVEHIYSQFEDTWFTGVWGIVYITTWMCSLLALHRSQVAGKGFGKWLITIMFFTLTIANISNIVQILTPANDPWYFFYLDLFWPISHLLMFVLGITCLFNSKLDKYSKIILAGAGLWLPIAFVAMIILGRTNTVILYGSIYNAVMWALMAYIAMNKRDNSQYAVA
jgi:hypothetical protein